MVLKKVDYDEYALLTTEDLLQVRYLISYIQFKGNIKAARIYDEIKISRDEFNRLARDDIKDPNKPHFLKLYNWLYNYVIEHELWLFYPQLADFIENLFRHQRGFDLSSLRSKSGEESLLLPYASPENLIFRDILEKFQHGGFIYRYAKNQNEDDRNNPRFAKGALEISQSDSKKYLEFRITYRVEVESDINEAFDTVINGRLMLMKAFIFFIGIENGEYYPFTMIMRSRLNGDRFKGLIMRKHPSKSYFVSRVIITANSAELDAPLVEYSGKFPASKIPEIDEKSFDYLKNMSTNDGYGILMLE